MANHMHLAGRVDMPAGKQFHGTLAWLFKGSGYQTAQIGKWQLGVNQVVLARN